MTTLTLHHEQVLVIGDGLTGLLAAQALTRFFRQVVVAAQLPAAAQTPAVAQTPVVAQPPAVEQPPVIEQPPVAAPPYLLNGRDQQTLAALFPGLLADLIAAGAVRFNLGLHVAWSVNGRWRPRYYSAYEPVVCPSDLLLAALRKRLVEETAVQFHAAAHQSRLEAASDLIVDTTGEANGTQNKPALLAGAGRLYQWPDGHQTSWQMLVIEPDKPAPEPRRGAVVLPFAAGQFYLALWGTAADPPPLDEAAFMLFARSLPNPALAELLAQAAPLTAVRRLPTTNWSSGCRQPQTGCSYRCRAIYPIPCWGSR
jgi:hypothetical protein